MVFLALILAVTKPMGVFMARVFNRREDLHGFAARLIGRLLYRSHPEWTKITRCGGRSILADASVQRRLDDCVVFYPATSLLPFNPQKLGAVNPPHLAFRPRRPRLQPINKLASRRGRVHDDYFTQTAGLAYHNFVFSGHGHRAGHCVYPGYRMLSEGDDRQLLGRLASELGAAAILHLVEPCCWFRRAWCRIFDPRHTNSG